MISDPVIMASIAAISSTVGAAISYLNNRAAGRQRKATAEIHVLVNSSMTRALTDLAMAQDEIRELRKLVIALNQRINEKDIS